MRTMTQQRTSPRAQGGQALIMFVFFMIVLILFVGLGIDLGFAYVTKANLSKSVDAAALAGIKNLPQGTVVATDLAKATFAANYGTPGRDVGPVTPNINFAKDSANNLVLNVNATATINTFFIRVLPTWKTLSVTAKAQTTRNKLIMSLVLDRSGSMVGNGGAAALPPAVGSFIDQFDDQEDRAAMVSFSYAASTDVTMRQPFKTDIKNAANALFFNGWTCSERGLTNGLVENESVTIQTNENVIKIIVFFSDGMANTWYYNFDCGFRNVAPDNSLYDPNTGSGPSSGCTVPSTVTSIDGATTVNMGDCVSMNTEAEKRAKAVASLARSQGNIVYAIGMGDPAAAGECGGVFRALNPAFLKSLANVNDPSNLDYNSAQPVGDYAIAIDSSQLQAVFDTIASKILLRLSQ